MAKITLNPDAIAKLLELVVDGDNSLISDLVGMFKKSASEKLEKMKAAVAANDWKELGYHAHSLKSSAGTLGAEDFRNTCQLIEDGCRTNATTNCTADVQKLVDAYPDVVMALDEMEKTVTKT